MNIEEAIDILENSIADYVIGEYCEKCADNKICDDRNEDCYYQQAIDTVVTAYEKEKGENVKLRLQDIPLIEGELKAYKDRVNELKAELEKEKEKNKKAIDFINERKKTVNKDMAEGTRLQVGTFMWQVDELLEILKEE